MENFEDGSSLEVLQPVNNLVRGPSDANGVFKRTRQEGFGRAAARAEHVDHFVKHHPPSVNQ